MITTITVVIIIIIFIPLSLQCSDLYYPNTLSTSVVYNLGTMNSILDTGTS